MTDNRNTIIAVILSGLVLLGWQYFFNIPQMEKQRAAQQAQQQTHQATPGQGSAPAQPSSSATPSATPSTTPGAAPAATTQSREAVLAAGPRIKIDTPQVAGSIALKGGRIDDVALVKYRETVDPNSPAVVLFSPSGTPDPYYAEFGWVGASGTTAKLPDANTV